MIVLLYKEGKALILKTVLLKIEIGFINIFLFSLSQGHGMMEMLMVERANPLIGQTHDE